jgi:Leucine-rich repeat (LRR) protein
LLISCCATQAQTASPCGQLSDEGVLKLKPKDWERTSELCDCSGLIALSLRKSPLLKLPPCIVDLQQMRSLDLSKSAMATFPIELTQLYGLEEISIANTTIAFLPDEVADLPNLRVLDLRGTGIEDLPYGLDHLERIDMRLIMLSKAEQDELRARFPNTQIFFSSPCHCH